MTHHRMPIQLGNRGPGLRLGAAVKRRGAGAFPPLVVVARVVLYGAGVPAIGVLSCQAPKSGSGPTVTRRAVKVQPEASNVTAPALSRVCKSVVPTRLSPLSSTVADIRKVAVPASKVSVGSTS